jgi:hypothetical protein
MDMHENVVQYKIKPWLNSIKLYMRIDSIDGSDIIIQEFGTSIKFLLPVQNVLYHNGDRILLSMFFALVGKPATLRTSL